MQNKQASKKESVRERIEDAISMADGSEIAELNCSCIHCTATMKEVVDNLESLIDQVVESRLREFVKEEIGYLDLDNFDDLEEDLSKDNWIQVPSRGKMVQVHLGTLNFAMRDMRVRIINFIQQLKTKEDKNEN